MAEQQPNGESSPKARPRVLAIDDQRDALRLLQARLQNAGMECVPCPDALAGFERAKREHFDLVILDVEMPNISGYELCRRLKLNDQTKDIPVLFLTARNDMEDKVRCLEAGGHDYLTKPVDQAELIARTRSALRVKHLQDQLKEQLELQQMINSLHQGMLSEHWQKTLGQLAASLAHEINNPLAAALGSVQLLRMDISLDEAVQHRLGIVDKSLQRAAEKLRSLLLIAQASKNTAPISLSELMHDILTIVNYEVVMNNIKLQTKLDPNCYWQGRPNDLARAILYILNNAIESVSEVENAEVRLAVERNGGLNRISIIDNGPGIPIELRELVFKPFFTTKTAPHNGVGLYLAREIVQSSHGKIELASGPGNRGCTVTVVLPALQMAHPSPELAL